MGRIARRNPTGPLRFSLLREIDECRWWDKTRSPDIAPRDDDYDHMIQIGEAADLLALEELGDGAIGHLIMHRNDTDEYTCRLWPNDFVPGRTIQIPTRESLSRRRII